MKTENIIILAIIGIIGYFAYKTMIEPIMGAEKAVGGAITGAGESIHSIVEPVWDIIKTPSETLQYVHEMEETYPGITQDVATFAATDTPFIRFLGISRKPVTFSKRVKVKKDLTRTPLFKYIKTAYPKLYEKVVTPAPIKKVKTNPLKPVTIKKDLTKTPLFEYIKKTHPKLYSKVI